MEQGEIGSVFSPSPLLPSLETQRRRAQILVQINLGRVIRSLTGALEQNGFNLEYFRTAIESMQELIEKGPVPLTVETALENLPPGLLDNSVGKIGPDRYIVAISVSPADPDAAEAIPRATVEKLRREFGPFTDFSYAKLNHDLQAQMAGDSRRVLLTAVAAVLVIVLACFRSWIPTLLVFVPSGFAVLTTFGLLEGLGYQFSYISVIALPLVIGIGIDGSIHLIQRYSENADFSLSDVWNVTGVPLTLSVLTTVVGFGSLVFSEFNPLAELGTVTIIGVGMTLVGSLFALPAILVFLRFPRNVRRQPRKEI